MGVYKYIKHEDKSGKVRWIAIPENAMFATEEMWDPVFLLDRLTKITAPKSVSSWPVQIDSKYAVLKVKYTYGDEQDRGDFSIYYDYAQNASKQHEPQELRLNVYDFYSKENLAKLGSCEFTFLIYNDCSVVSATNVNAQVNIDFITSSRPDLMTADWTWDTTTTKNLLKKEGPKDTSLGSHLFVFSVDDTLSLFINIDGCQLVDLRTSFGSVKI